MNNEETPFIIIGMPVYNGAMYLRNAIDSLLFQTYRNFILIISDDASTDATEKICREYASKDYQIRYHRQQKNMGITRNFNYVLDLALALGSDYFMWAAQDDLWEREYIKLCVDMLANNPRAVFCSSKTIFIMPDCYEIKDTDFANFSTIGMGTAKRIVHYLRTSLSYSLFYGLIRTDALRGKSLAHILGQDYLLMIELLLEGDIEIVKEYLYKKKIGGASESLIKLARTYGVRSKTKINWHRAVIFVNYLSVVLQSRKIGLLSKAYLFMVLPYIYLRNYFYNDLTAQKIFRVSKYLAYLRGKKSNMNNTLPLKILILMCLPLIYLRHYLNRFFTTRI